jgi:hypothetical protein
MNTYLGRIIDFNGDKDVIALREKYNKVSFFEIISKERSETTYSSFLKWLFQEGGENSDMCSPVTMLLDVLVRRYEEQKDYIETILKNENVKRSIVTRNLKIQSIKVETEKAVSNLAQEIISDKNKNGVLKNEDLKKIAANSQDRIDLFIDCEIESENDIVSARRLQIILENKIDSMEGVKKQNDKTGVKDYDDDAWQTTRYFLGSKFYEGVDADGNQLDGKDVLQIFVYLTPLSSDELSNFGKLKKLQQEYDEDNKKSKKRKRVICADKHYVQINYQDIVDGILMPMLASSSLSVRSRFFLEEFLNQLIFPSLDGTVMRPSIAISQEYSQVLSNLWNRYKDLLIPAAIAASESDFWTIDDAYYDHQPRTELLDLLLEKGIQSPVIIDGKWKPNTHFTKIQELAKEQGLETCQVDLGLDEDSLFLLSSFWDKNKRLLTAWMNGMKAEDRKKVDGLLSQASKRDTTKYNIYYNNEIKNKQPYGKGLTAFTIVSLWVEEQKSLGIDVTIDELNKTFPLSSNPYYDKNQAFSHLFYEWKSDNSYIYDGKKGNKNQVVGNWDFDKNGRFNLKTTDSKTITMLKMWRKDALEKLIGDVKKKKLFKHMLNVTPAD